MTLRSSLVAQRRTLQRPAQNANTTWVERETALLTLQGDDGFCGSGEAAPLPGFSPDSLADCRRALGELNLSDVPARLAPEHSVIAELERASATLRHVPAARAALECALIDLWARSAGVPAWALLRGNGEPPRTRRVAALLMGEPETALDQARAAQARGIGAFKLKVGRAGALEREVVACASLREALGAHVDLRLDANRAWPAADAREHLRQLARFSPEFVEEPCALADLDVRTPTPAPFALDESLLELSPDPLAVSRLATVGLRALILKPTVLGGISACSAWATAARACGVDVVISHAFEGPIGLALAATLALTLGSETAAHGLDLEGARLEHEILPQCAGPHVRAWSAPGLGAWKIEA